MSYTGKVCDVSPYSEAYQPMENIPIVTAATAWQSPVTGRTYILIFNEALWMGDSMSSTLINPNQLRHFGVKVQDDPTSKSPLAIIKDDEEQFCMELDISGTIIYVTTYTPTEKELSQCQHVILSSPHPWDPEKVIFPKSSCSLAEFMRDRTISATMSHNIIENETMECDIVFDLNSTIRKISKASTIEVPSIPTFESRERHTDVSPKELSERWAISTHTASRTLKNTTQKFLRSAILPLSRRYRADRMYHRKTLSGKWSTDTMDGRCVSLDGNKYAQIFSNKNYFSKVYPMDAKRRAGDALKLFCRDYGIPEDLTFDGSKEQTKKNTTFMKQIHAHNIKYHISEPGVKNQNPVERTIRELRKKWFRIMVKQRVPKELWDFGLVWVSEITSMTYTTAGSINGCIPITAVTGETPDISEYLDFGFYDKIWYKDNAGLSPMEPGRWLGVSSKTGRLMCYWILNKKGSIVSRSTVQRVTNLELETKSVQEIFHEFDESIHSKLKYSKDLYIGDKPNPDRWSELIDNDDDFREEFHRVFNDAHIPEADTDPTPEIGDDTYVNMELALPRNDNGPTFARVTKRLKNAQNEPIGFANENPILDTRVYEVEFTDGYKARLAANAIAMNMFSQVDSEGNRYVLFDSIVDHRVDGTQLNKDNAFISTKNGGRKRIKSTKGWEILVQWKDGTTSWEMMKDILAEYPVQLAEYAILKNLQHLPAFAWWVPTYIKKRNRIISKTKSKYWTRTHKFGFRIPHSVEEALQIDKLNNDNLWWAAICKEMKNVRIAFEEYDGDVKNLIGYKELNYHLIFDIKMGENFRRKARLVADGHKTQTPSAITYSSVVSRDSVRIALTIAALNDLKIQACDIQNAYLTAPCREKFYCIAGTEFGSEQGKIMIVTRALYGLKSSGAAFRSFLAEHLYDIGFKPSLADADVWMRPAIKTNGFEYWEYILCYVDDILAISQNPSSIMQCIQRKFKLKDDKFEEPSNYLGAELSIMDNEYGDQCWAMSSDKYCEALVNNVEEVLKKKGLKLPTKCFLPMMQSYKPELDCTDELDATSTTWFQELIGSLRWAIELGRVDILLETSLLSQHMALPREGHLEQLLHIIGYLKSHKKFRLLYDSCQPKVNENSFQKYDWHDFYREAKEAIPPNMPEARGHAVITSCFVDASHANNQRDRKSQTGILIFMNKAPIHWYSKRQSTVETSTFGAEFCAMKTGVEIIEGLRYKLRMFGIPIEGPTNIYCDNEAVYKNTVMPESTLKKKHHAIAYHRCREAVAAGTVRVAKQGTDKNLADLFTKILTSSRRNFLLDRFTY